MDNEQCAVGTWPHVNFHHVDPEAQGGLNTSQGILRFQSRGATVANAEEGPRLMAKLVGMRRAIRTEELAGEPAADGSHQATHLGLASNCLAQPHNSFPSVI